MSNPHRALRPPTTLRDPQCVAGRRSFRLPPRQPAVSAVSVLPRYLCHPCAARQFRQFLYCPAISAIPVPPGSFGISDPPGSFLSFGISAPSSSPAVPSCGSDNPKDVSKRLSFKPPYRSANINKIINRNRINRDFSSSYSDTDCVPIRYNENQSRIWTAFGRRSIAGRRSAAGRPPSGKRKTETADKNLSRNSGRNHPTENRRIKNVKNNRRKKTDG